MALIEKRAIFDILFTFFFLVTRKKLQKFLQHISHSQTYMYFAHPIDFFFALPISSEVLKKSLLLTLVFLRGGVVTTP